MKRLLIVLVLLLLPSCTVVVEEWLPRNPMNSVVNVPPMSVIMSPSGMRVEVETDAVLFPYGAFMQVISTLEKAVEIIEALESRDALDMPAENALQKGRGTL